MLSRTQCKHTDANTKGRYFADIFKSIFSIEKMYLD